MTDILVRELSRPERPALEAHLLTLGGQDRRLRFGAGYRVSPSLALRAELDHLLGPDALVA